VDIANNGREAVEKTKQKHYDLIFMDIEMPEMSKSLLCENQTIGQQHIRENDRLLTFARWS
jgi:CheY-like chemotaxis protein